MTCRSFEPSVNSIEKIFIDQIKSLNKRDGAHYKFLVIKFYDNGPFSE